ncbi:30S ribosome-binding factor RbfA [[Mycoplasma] testudinis]|uniref:30S ribosome-binding factor RbfA n=1 Tax=[Mycoplasma] testudinis TaxID=33924 RepID=UPI000489D00E|nr:30S ribosome-binding factor RbfA [[Mycoplasma] testudinis]
MPSYKKERLENQISSILNSTILVEIENPIVKLGSVTYVKLSPDFSVAKVYLDCLNRNEIDKVVAAFISASGVFKTALSKVLTIRRIPHLHFVADVAIDKSLEIENILREIKQENKA